jgi:hypothetical protein
VAGKLLASVLPSAKVKEWYQPAKKESKHKASIFKTAHNYTFNSRRSQGLIRECVDN